MAVDIFGFQWTGLVTKEKIDETFSPYAKVLAWEGYSKWTKSLIISTGGLSWLDAQELAKTVATPWPGATTRPCSECLWTWCVHAERLEGYIEEMIALLAGIGGATVGGIVGSII